MRGRLCLVLATLSVCAHIRPGQAACHDNTARFATKHEAEKALWSYVTSKIGRSGDDSREAAARLPPPGGTKVHIGMKIFKLDMDDDAQEVRMKIWFRRGWTDKRVTWDPAEYSYACTRLEDPTDITDKKWKKDVQMLLEDKVLTGAWENNELAQKEDEDRAIQVGAKVEQQGVCHFNAGLYVKSDEVWVPDVMPLNSFIGKGGENYVETGVTIQPDGERWLSEPMNIKFVDLNITVRSFPYDAHNVTLVMGSWHYSKNELSLSWSGTKTPDRSEAFGEGEGSAKIWEQCENRPCRDKCVNSIRRQKIRHPPARMLCGETKEDLNFNETKEDEKCKKLCKKCDPASFGWITVEDDTYEITADDDNGFYFSPQWCTKGNEDTGLCPVDFLRGTVQATGLGTLQNPLEWKFPGSGGADGLGPITWKEKQHIALRSHLTKYPCCDLPIPELEVSFELERVEPYHLWTSIFPMIVLTHLGVVVHILQGSSVESINWALGTSFTILLALYAHNIFLAENVPIVPLDSFVTVIFLQSLLATLLTALFTTLRYSRAHDLADKGHLNVKWIDKALGKLGRHFYLVIAFVYSFLTMFFTIGFAADHTSSLPDQIGFHFLNMLMLIFNCLAWAFSTSLIHRCTPKRLDDSEIVDIRGHVCTHGNILDDFEKVFCHRGHSAHLDKYKDTFYKHRIAPSQLQLVASAAGMTAFDILQKMGIPLADALEMTAIIQQDTTLAYPSTCLPGLPTVMGQVVHTSV